MNEKMMILKMLEEGKINAAEAARLLDSVDGAKTFSPKPAPPRETEPRRADIKDDRQTPPRTADRDRHDAPSSGPGGFEEFTTDLTKKFEQFARDIEPKLVKITETVAEKTAVMADKISKSLSAAPASTTSPDGLNDGARRPYAPPETPAAKKSYANMEEKIFESFVAPGANELSLSGLNGDVLIKGYNGDKLSARIYYKAVKGGAKIGIIKLGGKYFLDYEEDDFEKVAVDAFVPETMFNSVNIQTINGRLSVSTLSAGEFVLSNSNAATEVKDVSASNIKIDCTNGLLRLENLRGDNAKIENFNNNIQAVGVDVKNLDLTAQNGSVTMNAASFERCSDYIWAAEASNGKLTLNLPSSPDIGYHVKAHTTLSSIKIGLTGLSYAVNEPSYVEARSSAYDASPKKVRLSLETSNAPVVVN